MILCNQTFLRIYSVLTLCVTLNSAMGQSDDFGMWLSAELSKEYSKKTTFNLSQEFRFSDNMAELGSFFTDGGITYRLNKSFRVSGNYRYINSLKKNGSYSSRHRVYADLTYRRKIDPLTLSLRTRIQSQVNSEWFTDRDKIPKNYSRNKLSLSYNKLKKTKPYGSAELFLHLNDNDGIKIDNIRFALGTSFELNKRNEMEAFILHQRELNVNKPTRDFVVGVGYQRTLKKK
jgi:hypothetical protein